MMDESKAGAGSAGADGTGEDEFDLDWIPMGNGWQLVICDEEAWAEMGLTPVGFGRIVDCLQTAMSGHPDGHTTLAQREMEAIVAGRERPAIADGSPESEGPESSA